MAKLSRKKKHQCKNSKNAWFFNCSGFIDGNLFPLAFAHTLNTKDCFTSKGEYAIKGFLFAMMLQG